MRSLVRIGRGLRRAVLHALPTVIGILVLNFLLLQFVPGDAAEVIAGESGSATVESMAQLRAQFGLDRPMLTQLVDQLSTLSRFSLGWSPRYNAPVAELIMARLPNTLILMSTALATAFVLGIALGSIMASFAGRWPDRILSVLSLLLYSMPGFWVGLMAVVLFSVKLGWLPSDGNATIGASPTGWAFFADRASHLVLPMLALASFFVAVYARLTRAAVLEVLQQDFVRTAHAKGLNPFDLFVRHVLRNALVPITTVAGMHLGTLLGGSVVVETVFGWPGMGRLALEAMLARDFRVLLGVFFLSSVVVVFANAAIDLLHAWLDPRIAERET